MKNFFFVLTFLFVTLCLDSALAETVEFPEEDLASETVLPVFDKRKIVLNRNINKTKRIEVAIGAGWALNEPFYNPLNFNIMGNYHLSEIHGLGIQYFSFQDGLSGYGKQLQAGEADGQVFDASKAPALKSLLAAHYQFDAYYGKISLTKKGVMNLSLFGTAGIGFLGFDGVNRPGLLLGMGQNFYFGKNFALRYDLKMVLYNGPSPTSIDLKASSNPSVDDFEEDFFVNTLITVGASFLL